MSKMISWLFILTGIFAMVGSMFSWGEGWLVSNEIGVNTSILWADLLLTGPLCFTAGVLALKNSERSVHLLLLASGMILFGSIQVTVMMLVGQLVTHPFYWIPVLFGSVLAIYTIINTHSD